MDTLRSSNSVIGFDALDQIDLDQLALDGRCQSDLPLIDAGATVPDVRVEAETLAIAHQKLAEDLWQRPGGGRVAIAHRLAASVLMSLIADTPQDWRLSPLVRDVVVLGEAALPISLALLLTEIEPLVGNSSRSFVEKTVGNIDAAESRFRDVIKLAATIAREIATVP